MATPPPEVTAAVLDRTTQMRSGLVARLAQFVRDLLAIVRQSGQDAVPDAVEQIVTAVEQGRREVADLTEVYVETVLAIEGQPRPARARGTVDADEHEDLIDQWTDLVDRYVREADEEVLAEAERILADDLEDTHRSAVQTPTAIGYRRVIHPEMSAGGTCGLCVAAAHRIYTRANLKPIHDGCHCTVLPVTDEDDPGQDLNDADLAKVYAATGTTDGWTLKPARVRREDDGDLTVVQDRKKRGPRNARDGEDRQYDQATGLPEKSADWIRQQIDLTEALPDSEWRTRQLRRLRDELARR